MLLLAAQAPVATGWMRQLYAHPERGDRLVKVLRAEAIARRERGLRRLARLRHHVLHRRELRETLALAARGGGPHGPVARAMGLVPTDLGLGLEVERVDGEDGALAPTVDALVAREGFAPWIRAGIAALMTECLALGVVLHDVHGRNIVYGRRGHGPPRFVFVDGIGDKNALPLRSLVPALNRRNTRALAARLEARVQHDLRHGAPV